MNQHCCGGEEKNNKKDDMMPKMAKKMMKKMQGGNFNPKEMCQQMMNSIESTAKLAGLANPEVQLLFEEWVTEVEKEILDLLSKKENLDLEEIAKELKISENSLRYFISKLIRDQKIKITNLEIL